MTKEETIQSIRPEIADGSMIMIWRGDSDKLSASAMFKSYHKGMWAFATLLYHVIQLSGGIGQALK